MWYKMWDKVYFKKIHTLSSTDTASAMGRSLLRVLWPRPNHHSPHPAAHSLSVARVWFWCPFPMQTSAVQVHSIDSHPGNERLLGVSASALALSACGGGGAASSASTGGAAQGAVSPNALPDAASASRLINQAAFGGNRAALDAMTQKGASAWLTEQMDMPRSQSMTDWLIAKGFADAAVNGNINGDGGWPNAMWWKLFAAPDAVRQRAVLAWSGYR